MIKVRKNTQACIIITLSRENDQNAFPTSQQAQKNILNISIIRTTYGKKNRTELVDKNKYLIDENNGLNHL